jgi:hypothetical protein
MYQQPLASAGGCTPNPNDTGCPGDVVADLEWGQGDNVGNQFTMRESGSALDEFEATDAVVIDGNGTLWVADSAADRVLGFQNALTTFTAHRGARRRRSHRLYPAGQRYRRGSRFEE